MSPIDAMHVMPGHLVRRAHQAATALFAAECGAFDLTAVQYAALVAIGAYPGLDATRLAILVAFDRSTIGDVLERLEAKGWVNRRPSPGDRRSKQIALSPAGQRLLDRVQPAVDRVQQRLLEPLDASERSSLVDLLARIAATAAAEPEASQQSA